MLAEWVIFIRMSSTMRIYSRTIWKFLPEYSSCGKIANNLVKKKKKNSHLIAHGFLRLCCLVCSRHHQTFGNVRSKLKEGVKKIAKNIFCSSCSTNRSVRGKEARYYQFTMRTTLFNVKHGQEKSMTIENSYRVEESMCFDLRMIC